MIVPESPIHASVRASVAKKKTEHELDNRFTYHAPKGDQAERYGNMKAAARMTAQKIIDLTPVSREQSSALAKLDEVVFWANAAIARNE